MRSRMSSEQTTWAIELPLNEYIYLASLFSTPEWVIGVEKPENVDALLEQARIGLEKKEYFSTQGGAVQVDYAIARLFDVIASGKRSLIVHHSPADPSARCSTWIHIGVELLVAMRMVSRQAVELIAFQDVPALVQWLNAALALPVADTAAERSFTIEAELLEQASRHAGLGQAEICNRSLLAAGLDSQIVEQLCSCFASRPVSGSLSAINRESPEPVLEESLAWLVGAGNAWAVLPVAVEEAVAVGGKVRLVSSSTRFIEHRAGVLLQEAAHSAGYAPVKER